MRTCHWDGQWPPLQTWRPRRKSWLWICSVSFAHKPDPTEEPNTTKVSIYLMIWREIQSQLTSVARVDFMMDVSYTHPSWQCTVGNTVALVEFSNRWYWGSANIWQELKLPSSSTGILTMSFSSLERSLKTSLSSKALMLQWWEGINAVKLFCRKWKGKIRRGITNISISLHWNRPKPFTSANRSSNFIMNVRVAMWSEAQRKQGGREICNSLYIENSLILQDISTQFGKSSILRINELPVGGWLLCCNYTLQDHACWFELLLTDMCFEPKM